MQHISALNLLSFRWKFLRRNSESMSLLIDVLLAIKRCYQNLSLRYQGYKDKESISRYEYQPDYQVHLEEVLFVFEL